MTEMPPIATAWASVAAWAVKQGATAVDQMEANWQGETDDWEITINGSNEERDTIPPKGIVLRHKTFISFAVLGPFEGCTTGVSEEEIIAHFGDPE